MAGLAVAGALAVLAVRVHGRTRWLLVGGVTVPGCALGLEIVQGLFRMLASAATGVSITRDGGGLALRYRAQVSNL